jgi:hypothetical protein
MTSFLQLEQQYPDGVWPSGLCEIGDIWNLFYACCLPQCANAQARTNLDGKLPCPVVKI